MTTVKNDLIIKASIILSLFIFAALTICVRLGLTYSIDHAVYIFIAGYISPGLTKVNIWITRLGSTRMIATGCLLLLFFSKTRMKVGLPVAFTMAVSVFLNSSLKLFFARNRPDILRLISESGFSFPSGHAMNNMALYTILVFLICYDSKNSLLRWIVSVIAFLFVFLIGLSRIYLGVHYFSDVLAGFCLGYSVAASVFLGWGNKMNSI